MRTALCVSVFTTAVTIGSAAFAGPEQTTASGGSYRVYGQLNPSVAAFDDGVSRTTAFGDNASSVSRIGFRFRQPFGDNTFTFRFETALGFGALEDFSQTDTPPALEIKRTDIRRIDFEYETARFGTFYLGQGSMASDGLGDRDMSGTGLAGSVAIGDIAGSFEFATTTGALSGVTISDAFPGFDGSRRGRVRYDTPEFGGFTLGFAYGQDILSDGPSRDFYDIGLGYEAEYDTGIEVEAGLGLSVRENSGSSNREDIFASVSVLMPSGVNVTIAAGERNTAGSYRYVKLGYIAELFDIGDTAMSIDVYSGSDTENTGDRATSIGLAVVQEFDDRNIDAYFGYRTYSYSDLTATTYRDAASYVMGARWRF